MDRYACSQEPDLGVTRDEWVADIERLRNEPAGGNIPDAEMYVGGWPSMSRPIAATCTDGITYVLKGLRNDREMSRALVTEHVAARLGKEMGCPIPDVSLVQMSASFIEAEPKASHFLPGLCHGVELTPGKCHDEKPPQGPTDSAGRRAYASLAVFYGWFLATSDHQIVVSDVTGAIYSVDHGLFLPDTENWSEESLASAPAPSIDGVFGRFLAPGDHKDALELLESVTDERIAMVLGAIPDTWGISVDDCAALGEYLSSRRDVLVSSS